MMETPSSTMEAPLPTMDAPWSAIEAPTPTREARLSTKEARLLTNEARLLTKEARLPTREGQARRRKTPFSTDEPFSSRNDAHSWTSEASPTSLPLASLRSLRFSHPTRRLSEGEARRHRRAHPGPSSNDRTPARDAVRPALAGLGSSERRQNAPSRSTPTA